MSPPQRGRGGRGGYRQQQYQDEGGDYRRQAPPNDRPQRTNNFDVEDYDRSGPTSYNRGRGARSNYSEQQGPPRRQRRDYDQYENEEERVPASRQNPAPVPDQTFHRERNFTNSQYQQQQRNAPRPNRDDQRRFDGPPNQDDYERSNRGGGGRNGNRRNENNNEPPPRRQGNYNNNNRDQPSTQSRQGENGGNGSNLSAEAPSFERPKRYSNMRSNASNSGQQQQQSPMQMQGYQDQHSNHYESSRFIAFLLLRNITCP